jgi:hypothetical protein
MVRALAFVLLSSVVTACTSNNAASPSEAGTSDKGTGEAGPLHGAGGDGRPTVCASPDDCKSFQHPVCCVANACVSNPPPNNLCADGNVQLIQASNYDQSCEKDSDCVAVAEGNRVKTRTTCCRVKRSCRVKLGCIRDRRGAVPSPPRPLSLPLR